MDTSGADTPSPQRSSVGHSVLGAFPGVVLAWTRDGTVVYGNDAAQRLTNYEDLSSVTIDELVSCSAPDGCSASFWREDRVLDQARIHPKTGTAVPVRGRLFEVNLDGAILYAGAFRPREDSSEDAGDRASVFGSPVDGSHEAVALVSSSGEIVRVNDAFCALTGYARGDLSELHVHQLYTNGQAHEEIFDRVCRDGDVQGLDIHLCRNDGRTVPAQVTATPWTPEGEAVEGARMVFTDHTDRHKFEEQFRHLVDQVREYAIFMLDAEGRVITWNEGAERIKGYAEDEIVGSHFSQFYPQGAVDAGIPAQALERAARDGQWTSEGWRVRKDGSRFWAHVTITALYGEDESVQGYAKVTRNMTERREHEMELEVQKARAEEAKRRAERENTLLRLLQSVATMANDADTLVDALERGVGIISRHIDWPIAHVYWVRPDREPALESSQIWHLEDDDRFASFQSITEGADYNLNESLPARTVVRGAPVWIRNVHKDATFRRSTQSEEIEVRGAFALPIQYDGDVVAVLEFFSDEEEAPDSQLMEALASVGVQLSRVAEREQARTSHLRSERRYRRLFETIQEGILIQASDRTITDLNSAAEEIVGYDRSALLGRRPDGLFVDPNQARQLREHIHAHGHLQNVEMPIRRKDGSTIIIEATSTFRRDAHDESEAFYTIFHDVTERKEMQEALEASEERYRRLFEESRDAILLTTPDGRVVDANSAAEDLFGYPREELMELDAASLYANPRERSTRIVPTIRESQSSQLLEAEMRHADGHTFLATASVTVHRDDENEPELIQALVRDITERRRLEEELLEIQDEERMRLGQELHDGVSSRLTAAGIKLSTLAAELEKDNAITPTDLEEAEAFVRQAGEEARAISHGLSPVGLDGGLLRALDDLASQTEVRGDGACTFAPSGPAPDLDEDTATHLYRIAQEAMSNAVKHADAEHIRMSVATDREDETLSLVVRDDGDGYRASSLEDEGLGMRTMRYRANLIDASITLEQPPEGGTIVRCRLPLSGE